MFVEPSDRHFVPQMLQSFGDKRMVDVPVYLRGNKARCFHRLQAQVQIG
jgi:hypothetical protein